MDAQFYVSKSLSAIVDTQFYVSKSLPAIVDTQFYVSKSLPVIVDTQFYVSKSLPAIADANSTSRRAVCNCVRIIIMTDEFSDNSYTSSSS